MILAPTIVLGGRGGFIFDAAARAFIDAAGITTPSRQLAINYLAKNLKSNGLWSGMIALYPFAGAGASAHSYNLINPSTFQITWAGTVTHNANGFAGNGTTGYGNTGISNSSLNPNSFAGSAYARTWPTGASFLFGARSWSIVGAYSIQRDGSATGVVGADVSGYGRIATSETNLASYIGLFSGVTTSSAAPVLYRNGVNINNSSTNTPTTPAGQTIFIGALNQSGIPISYSTANIALESFGTGRSPAEELVFSGIVQQYQTLMGRQV